MGTESIDFAGIFETYHSYLSSTNSGKGKLQCIAICVLRNYPFITNDKKAKNFAKKKMLKHGTFRTY